MQKLRPPAEILKRVLREQGRHPCQVSQSEKNGLASDLKHVRAMAGWKTLFSYNPLRAFAHERYRHIPACETDN
jgi:hypothetical protein